MAILGLENSLLFIIFANFYLIIGICQIKFSKSLSLTKSI